MKLVYAHGPDYTIITKEYAPGEKYSTAIAWDKKNGKVTKEKVETMFPGYTFLRAEHHCVREYPSLKWATATRAIIERTFRD